MKDALKLILCSLVIALAASAQTSIDVSAIGSIISSDPLESRISVPAPPLAAVIVNGAPHFGNLGIASLLTSTFATGDLQNGGTLSAGGTLNVAASSLSLNFTGTITSATWTLITLANGTHSYTLSGSVLSSEGSGSFVLSTSNTGLALWPGSAGVRSFQIHIDKP